MITGTTSSGFSFTVSEKLKNDFRFVLAYARMTGGNAAEQLAAPVELVNMVLGQEGAAALYAHVAEADGTIPTDRVMSELGEIIAAAGKGDRDIKN